MFTSREVAIKKINWGDNIVEICFGDPFRDDEEWFDINIDAMFTTHDWKKILKKKSHIRIWTIQTSKMMGIEWWNHKLYCFEPVWVVCNDF